MSEITTPGTDLTSQYAAQVAGDLERNIKEQERVSAEIVALQDQLAALHHDHAVLVTMQQALGIAPAPAAPAPTASAETKPEAEAEAEAETGAESATTAGPAAGGASVPAPRKESAAPSGTSRRTRTKKPTAARGATGAGRTAVAKGARPTLVELVRRHLAEQGEPRSTAEITAALGEAHPERGVKPTVVRTTLEGLVARNQAQRSKQGTSVFYTVPGAPEQPTVPGAGAQSEESEESR
ncbi:hypothetical protein ACFSL4_12580 [Streptomyces caeni]|uniref:Regulatory protein n=1 Tax=Streptomyces caeni TaxID=2307231 RepID=A0ABW4IR92_9ACTN